MTLIKRLVKAVQNKPTALPKYHWLPDVPDYRDHAYSVTKAAEHIAIPRHSDLRALCSAVENQGSLGSCTGNAIVGALEFLQKVEDPKHVSALSRLFVYYNERAIEGTVSQDAGAQIRNGIKVVATTGVCHEKYWPYRVTKFKSKPPQVAYDDAAKRKFLKYQRIQNLDELKHALSSNRPVVFGFSVYENFEGPEVAATGIVKVPTTTEQNLGGHAVLAVGHDDDNQRVLVRNSWGKEWGLAGYFWLPYEYITNRGLSDDFWCIINSK